MPIGAAGLPFFFHSPMTNDDDDDHACIHVAGRLVMHSNSPQQL
jgi:hypothetical protein